MGPTNNVMYGKIEWKWTLIDVGKAPDVAYHDILNEFNSTWEVKGLNGHVEG